VRNISELQIRHENSVTIINKPSEIEGLEIFYNKIAITDLNKTTLRITNKSKKAVTKSDFIEPLNLNFPDSMKIISYEIEEKRPENFSTVIVIDSTRQLLHFEFDLFNPQDYIVVGILHTGKFIDLEATARIKGIGSIVYQKIEKPIKKVIAPSIVAFFLIVATFILGIFTREKRECGKFNSEILNVDDFSKSKDEVLNALQKYLSAWDEKEISDISLLIKQIFNQEKIEHEDKVRQSYELISTELEKNIKVNRKAALITKTIIAIAAMYLTYWIITIGNILYK